NNMDIATDFLNMSQKAIANMIAQHNKKESIVENTKTILDAVDTDYVADMVADLEETRNQQETKELLEQFDKNEKARIEVLDRAIKEDVLTHGKIKFKIELDAEDRDLKRLSDRISDMKLVGSLTD